jgi:hypothetical protein
VTDNNPEKVAQALFDLKGVIQTSTIIYDNTREELIIVSKDKLQLCLQDNMDRMGKQDRWMAPLGVLVPLVLTAVTATFTERFGIAGDVWEAIFVLLGVLAMWWLIYALKQRGKSVTAASIVEELTKNPTVISASPSVDVSNQNIGSNEYDSIGRNDNPQSSTRMTQSIASRNVMESSAEPKSVARSLLQMNSQLSIHVLEPACSSSHHHSARTERITHDRAPLQCPPQIWSCNHSSRATLRVRRLLRSVTTRLRPPRRRAVADRYRRRPREASPATPDMSSSPGYSVQSATGIP